MNAMDAIGLECYIDGKDCIEGAIRLVPWGQGFVSMAPAIDAIEESILSRRFKHDSNPCLTWNFSNAVVKENEVGDRKFDKTKTRFRIDGAVSCAMAIGLKSKDRVKEPMTPISIYEGLTKDQILERMRA
jgi:phage terminase large subunit-like protein